MCAPLAAPLLAAALSLAAVGCGPARTTPSTADTPPLSPPAAVLPSPPNPVGACRADRGLEDRACTPGATNPQVTQQTIAATICVAGWTATVRPPAAYTGALKRRQLAAYGYYAGHDPAGYEEDHLISLELGGSPTDPRNLWPEAHAWPDGSPGSKVKDRLENALRADVCAGRLPLAAAQAAIVDFTSAKP